MDSSSRSPWDIRRLLRTLVFFEVLPFLGCLYRLFNPNLPAAAMTFLDDLNAVAPEGQSWSLREGKLQPPPHLAEVTLMDFTRPAPGLGDLWGAVDDVVMGGVSASQFQILPGRAVFSGQVSTDNNGGFASVRTKTLAPPLDLSDYDGIELRVQGDGKRYKLILRSEDKWDGVGYSYSFDAFNNHPQTLRIPFRRLIPVFRAKSAPERGAFDRSRLSAVQIMHSKFEYDGRLNPLFSPGFFSLEIFSIRAYRDGAGF
jgi:hypothetical protein